MAGMSPQALERCRRLRISEQGEITLLEVIDPRIGDKVVATYRARSKADVTRVTRAFVTKFRIPKELINRIGGRDASNTDTGTPGVHESGDQVLGSNEG